jgi:PKD repeat protein
MALLKDIIAELNTIAGAFTSVNSFYFDEINAINDNRAKQYPCIIVDSRNVNILASEVGRSNMPNKVNYTLKVAFFDVVNKNNTREVNYSNLELIALQFFAEIKRRTEVFNEDFMFVSASTYNGFALDQLHNDNLVQIIFDVQFNAIRNCSLGTFTDMPPPPTTDATVNINGNLFTLIASGGVGNITVRNTTGTEVGSNVDGVWVVPNGVISNSNDSYTSSVASGGTLVLPDITVTDSDGSTSTVPSVTNVVCTPQEVMTVDFTADKVEVEISEDVTFTDLTDENPTEWAWDFGDNTTSDLQNPVKSWVTAGTFDIRLIAAKIGLGGFARKLAYIEVITKKPSQIFGANLYDWWDFTDTSTQSITGGLINSITSKGTNAAVFSSSGTERPASIVGINGLNVADFDGVNDFMQVATSTAMYNFLHNGSLGAAIILNRIEDLNPGNAQILLDNAGFLSANIGITSAYDDRVDDRFLSATYRGTLGLVQTVNTTANGAYLSQQYNQTVIKLDTDNGVIADRNVVEINNGTEIKNNSTNASQSVANASFNFTIGKNANASTYYLKGQISEVIILTSHPTPTQITQLNNYYTNKYGGTFPIV